MGKFAMKLRKRGENESADFFAGLLFALILLVIIYTIVIAFAVIL